MSILYNELLTTRFYEWEHRGRGWYTFDEPVDIEPPYLSFKGHFAPTVPIKDDTRRSFLGKFFGKKKEVPEIDPFSDFPKVEPFAFNDNFNLWLGNFLLPKDQKIEVEEIEHLLLMLSYTEYPISFEIIGTYDSTRIQIVCRRHEAVQIQSQIHAYFPAITIEETQDNIALTLIEDDKCYTIQHYALKSEFMRPIASADRFDPDPLSGLLAVLETTKPGERAILQVLFKGTVNPWAESIMRSVTDINGDSFFADAPEMVKLAEKKVALPLYAVCIRSIVQSNTLEDSDILHNRLCNAIQKISMSGSNQLIPVVHDIYPVIKIPNVELPTDAHLAEIILRRSHRLGMILNSAELATFVHFPNQSVVSEKLLRETKRTKQSPGIAIGNDFAIGTNIHQGSEQIVSLSTNQRLRHMHIIGATGTGKSTFLLNLIAQDIVQGRGLAVIDPHGDLIESILAYIPASRLDDVVLIDPADADFPVGFNMLSAHTEIEKEILSSDLVSVFRRLSTSWGDQMNSVLANAILAFLESSEGGTLSDLRRFLLETPYRNEFLKTVTDTSVIHYWQYSYPLLKSSSIGSILTRLDAFLRPKLIRNMVVQKKGLDFEQLMDSRKIVLVKLPQGLIGTENSYLLGTLIVSKIYQAAMARQAKTKTDRSEFYLYVDEFHNFITPSMSAILSGARKYGLGLIIAHQEMMQLQKFDSELASSVIANPGIRVCFRLGDIDAKKFQDGFSFFTAQDLQNLKTGEAIMRVDRPEYDFTLQVTPLTEILPEQAQAISQTVISKSRQRYATPRDQVETLLSAAIQIKTTLPQISPPPEKMPTVSPALTTIEPVVQKTPITSLQAKPKVVTDHRYLQMLIKRMAEARGYKVALEEPTPDGNGRVDVSLERNGKKIACEISVTTADTWEVHNAAKCFAAGYDTVIVCSNNSKHLEKIQKLTDAAFISAHASAMAFYTPEQVFQFLNAEILPQAKTETVIKGYRVKVEYDSVSAEEMNAKQNTVIKTVASSIRKKKS